MIIGFWILQIGLGWLCIAGGYYKIFKLKQLQSAVMSMSKLPATLWTAFGVFEIVVGLSLIIPDAIRQYPQITTIAAFALALESFVICAFYIKFKDYAPMKFTLLMMIIALIIGMARLP